MGSCYTMLVGVRGQLCGLFSPPTFVKVPGIELCSSYHRNCLYPPSHCPGPLLSSYFLDTGSPAPAWPGICYVAEDNLEFLILLPPPPKG